MRYNYKNINCMKNIDIEEFLPLQNLHLFLDVLIII